MTIEAGGQDTTDTGLLAITSSGTANTKGSWGEIIASTTNATEWIAVQFRANLSDETFLIDIATGAASSEVVVIGDIHFWSNNSVGDTIYLPLTIASGTRISARCQATGTSAPVEVSIYLVTGDEYGTSASNITLGADTSASKGTVVDCGAIADTKSGWVELDSSTSADIDWLVIKFDPNDNAATANYRFLIDIATGAAASEVVLIPDIYHRNDQVEMHQCKTFMFRETIASGTRVSVRGACSGVNGADRIFGASIIGCNMTAPAAPGGATPHNPFGIALSGPFSGPIA